ncbi:MAG: 2Fe-2S iron-sulfur cluster-binding protein [Bacteroidota bacterium]|nr:2Fe-2S iron-sulfur cluster-binding protein [Bacteroidota bacterium]
MITITIDGREVRTQPGKTIIEAAFENGVYIPHFCWHPALSVSGNCRMCLVEVDGLPKLVVACATLCTDGMVLRVDSERAIAARHAVMEFLLINHPLDCPICDEAGECKLQDYAYRYGPGESRFDEEKVRQPKRVDIGPHVVFDAERCIACSRCIRFCSEILHDPRLTFVGRGDRVAVATFPGVKLENPYSMNIIELCPVGALTSRDFRFKARVWEMSDTPSVCPGCARGCSVHVWVRRNEILRMTPRENRFVNGTWMCDFGRLESWRHAADENRLMKPALRRAGGIVEPVPWDEALPAAAERLRRAAEGRIAVLGSGFDTCEGAYALARFAREVLRTPFIDSIPYFDPEQEDDFLRRADRTPNTTGARLAGVAPADERYGLAAIVEGLERGEFSALVATDSVGGGNGWIDAARERLESVIFIGRNASPLAERADILLPATNFAEENGTYVNFENRLQLLHPALVTKDGDRRTGPFRLSRLDAFATPFDRWGRMPKRDARPLWRILRDLAGTFGIAWGWEHPRDVFAELAHNVPAFRGLAWDAIGPEGVPLGGEASPPIRSYRYSDIRP